MDWSKEQILDMLISKKELEPQTCRFPPIFQGSSKPHLLVVRNIKRYRGQLPPHMAFACNVTAFVADVKLCTELGSMSLSQNELKEFTRSVFAACLVFFVPATSSTGSRHDPRFSGQNLNI